MLLLQQAASVACYGGLMVISSLPPTLSPQPLSWRKKTPKIKMKSGQCIMRRALIISELELKPPPYSLNSLEPHLSRETLELHWGSHHRAHVARLNSLIAGTDLDGMGLDDIVIATYNKGSPRAPFVHAAEVWNHDFFWQSIKPNGGGQPSGKLMELIERDFGSFSRMLKEFENAALTQFGSGWVWLAYKANKLDVGNAVNPCPSEKDNKLIVLKSPNAVNPFVWDYSPLLCIDVWEHAYYLDYENRRDEYVAVFLEKLVSWEVVSHRLDIAIKRAADRAREDEKDS
ncbi:iron superoxide dismutase [Canna indica]|uniref:superoxide dismutase n=1 Tax=Canna indica TaxID=4628 RepID=A0AAQ3QBD2_9LILI|nr:iron superoxide dismutase [Canna indica]